MSRALPPGLWGGRLRGRGFGGGSALAAFGFLVPPPPNGTLTRIAGREAKYDQGKSQGNMVADECKQPDNYISSTLRNAATYSSIHKGRTLSGTPSSGARSLRCRLANCARVRTHTAHTQCSGHRGGDAEEDRSPSGERSSSASGRRSSSASPSASANDGCRLRLAALALREIFPSHSRRALGSEGGSR
eukprot:gene81-biopygen7551